TKAMRLKGIEVHFEWACHHDVEAGGRDVVVAVDRRIRPVGAARKARRETDWRRRTGRRSERRPIDRSRSRGRRRMLGGDRTGCLVTGAAGYEANEDGQGREGTKGQPRLTAARSRAERPAAGAAPTRR